MIYSDAELPEVEPVCRRDPELVEEGSRQAKDLSSVD
jgi:hypothetical protein